MFLLTHKTPETCGVSRPSHMLSHARALAITGMLIFAWSFLFGARREEYSGIGATRQRDQKCRQSAWRCSELHKACTLCDRHFRKNQDIKRAFSGPQRAAPPAR